MSKKQITIRMSTRLHQRMEELAKKKGVPVATYIVGQLMEQAEDQDKSEILAASALSAASTAVVVAERVMALLGGEQHGEDLDVDQIREDVELTTRVHMSRGRLIARNIC